MLITYLLLMKKLKLGETKTLVQGPVREYLSALCFVLLCLTDTVLFHKLKVCGKPAIIKACTMFFQT